MKNELEKKYEMINKTPIEIALDVDEEGRTTAKKLYSWLELNSSNYSKWLKRNILDNQFAETNKDFYSYQSTNEGRGNFAEDYILTADFAKKLAMTTKSLKGEEARDYFIKVEDKLKEVVKDMKSVLSEEDKYILKLYHADTKEEMLMIAKQHEQEIVQPLRDSVDRYERFLCEKTGYLTKTELATKLDTCPQTLASKLKKIKVYTPTSKISEDFLKKYPDVKMIVEKPSTFINPKTNKEEEKVDWQWTYEGSKILVDYLISLGMITYTDNNGFKLNRA